MPTRDQRSPAADEGQEGRPASEPEPSSSDVFVPWSRSFLRYAALWLLAAIAGGTSRLTHDPEMPTPVLRGGKGFEKIMPRKHQATGLMRRSRIRPQPAINGKNARWIADGRRAIAGAQGEPRDGGGVEAMQLVGRQRRQIDPLFRRCPKREREAAHAITSRRWKWNLPSLPQ